MRFLLAAVLLFVPALQDTPPKEPGPLRAADLVELTALDPTIKLDIRYATADNLAGRPVYRKREPFSSDRRLRRSCARTARSASMASVC